jgi:hypothetical protein
LEDVSVDGNIILKWIFEKLNGDVYLFDLAADRDMLWAIVNVVMKFPFP